MLPRVSFPTVGHYRYRDMFLLKNGKFVSPVFTCHRVNTQHKITVIPVHLQARPSFYSEVEDHLADHNYYGQIHSQEDTLPSPAGRKLYSYNSDNREDYVLPLHWSVPGNVYGIDSKENRALLEFSVILFGHFVPNSRAALCAQRIREVLKKHNPPTLAIPIPCYHAPTILKALEDDGYVIRNDDELVVANTEAPLQKEKVVIAVSYLSLFTIFSCDFFPTFVIFLVLAMLPAIDNQPSKPQQENPSDQQYLQYPINYQRQQNYPLNPPVPGVPYTPSTPPGAY